MLDLHVIGAGGIGGYLIERLPMVISSLSLDLLESRGVNIQPFLDGAGFESVPLEVRSLVLADGDVFNPRNAMRQGAGAGNKLIRRLQYLRKAAREMSSAATDMSAMADAVRAFESSLAGLGGEGRLKEAAGILSGDRPLMPGDFDRIRSSMVMASFLQRLELKGFNAFVKPDNIGQVIPRHRDPAGTAVVFLCVDNLKTRYEVSKYMETFSDCLVLNGGNSKTKGHVTVYERRQGQPLDPPIYEIYPEVSADADKRPDEVECGAVAPSHDQIAVTNSLIADVMLARFVSWARKGLSFTRKPDDPVSRTVRYNEVLIDIEVPSVMPLYHPLKD